MNSTPTFPRMEWPSEEDAAAIEAFYLPKKIDGAERTVTQAAEAVRAKSARLARDADVVGAWVVAAAAAAEEK